MNFREHYQINEGILSHEYKICAFFDQNRFNNLKHGRPEEVWKKEIKNIKQDIIFSIANILNNILFDGVGGALSDGRMDIKIDMDSLDNTLRVVTMYAIGVKIPVPDKQAIQIYHVLNKVSERVTSVKITLSHDILKQHLDKELKGKSKEEVEQTLDTLKKI